MSDAVIRIAIDSRDATNGARTIRRDLDSIEGKTNNVRSAMSSLAKVAAGAFALETFRRAAVQLQRVADAATVLENRIIATGTATAQLEGVFNQLSDVAIATRSNFQGTVEVFSRLAVSSSELGVSQQQLIGFTKSLNQAVQLSGASAIEANAALIQLSQGLASGTLRGDELRSVLEQLPIVADVIAQEFGVTRGALRALGADGEISAQRVLAAFSAAGDDLEQRFAKQISTVAQEAEVLNTAFVRFARNLDDVIRLSDLSTSTLRGLTTVVDGLNSAITTFDTNRGLIARTQRTIFSLLGLSEDATSQEIAKIGSA
ncbi:MAG: tape measure protein, partial [Pseudomonadota bacterium]